VVTREPEARRSAHFDARRNAGTDAAIGMHAFARRVADWEAHTSPSRVVMAPHGREWLAAVEELRRSPSMIFVADPRRTDFALFDPHSLMRSGSYTWGFSEPAFVGGARPGSANLYRIQSPGWMLDRGWALTAEIGGITERDGGGPHKRPSVGWIRSRPDSAVLLIGGRHLGAVGDPPAEIAVTAQAILAQWTVSGFRQALSSARARGAELSVPAFIR
jgi:hypothetical protein